MGSLSVPMLPDDIETLNVDEWDDLAYKSHFISVV